MAKPDPAIRAIIKAVHDTWPEWDLKFAIKEADGKETLWQWDAKQQRPVKVAEGQCDSESTS